METLKILKESQVSSPELFLRPTKVVEGLSYTGRQQVLSRTITSAREFQDCGAWRGEDMFRFGGTIQNRSVEIPMLNQKLNQKDWFTAGTWLSLNSNR